MHAQEQAFGISDIIRLVLEAVVIYIGASMLVEVGPKLARAFGVPEMIISLTFVALGTSLPELVTSLMALRKTGGMLLVICILFLAYNVRNAYSQQQEEKEMHAQEHRPGYDVCHCLAAQINRTQNQHHSCNESGIAQNGAQRIANCHFRKMPHGCHG